MSFQKKKKTFVLKIVSYMAYCMLREVGEGLVQGS